MPKPIETVKAGDKSLVINATPTKELFIDMLTRDIALVPAIIDLVDNCADGAKKIAGDKPLKDYWARLTINKQEFVIADNCAGITIDTARNYAFRFGRAEGAPSVKHSVGQFGVGMKRALFKLGSAFRVDSRAEYTSFTLNVDVRTWQALGEWAL